MIQRFKKFNEEAEIETTANNLGELKEFSDKEYTSIGEEDLKVTDSRVYMKRGHSMNEILNSSSKNLVKILHAALNESKDELSQLLVKKISEEDIVDYLLKLDNVVIKELYKPIKLIEELSGWNIHESISKVRK